MFIIIIIIHVRKCIRDENYAEICALSKKIDTMKK